MLGSLAGRHVTLKITIRGQHVCISAHLSTFQEHPPSFYAFLSSSTHVDGSDIM